MKYFAVIVLFVGLASLTMAKPTEIESLEETSEVKNIIPQSGNTRDKRGLLFGAAYTAPIATAAYAAPVAYTSAYTYSPYSAYSAYSSYPYAYASAYSAPYYLA
ncbi:hypothetical protein HCN44_001840 [Aphidius gifuensis]|uniref:Uncharacterized protein n=1 Tax=Aphidius gifuensis TaxID=684658 RepID=A0A834XZ13_APHGI|nr:uncharacterized protein LOC122861067 [Aphidius gifuensis]KAF7996208.1 hypothetical protein HCN44_001840 [Aphidius gifuensis]